MSSIGRYAVILMGFDDSEDLKDEVKKASNLIYIKPFAENAINVDSYETDKRNPRYGKPKLYSLRISAENSTSTEESTVIAHYSRVVHIAPPALSPAMSTLFPY